MENIEMLLMKLSQWKPYLTEWNEVTLEFVKFLTDLNEDFSFLMFSFRFRSVCLSIIDPDDDLRIESIAYSHSFHSTIDPSCIYYLYRIRYRTNNHLSLHFDHLKSLSSLYFSSLGNCEVAVLFFSLFFSFLACSTVFSFSLLSFSQFLSTLRNFYRRKTENLSHCQIDVFFKSRVHGRRERRLD